MDVIQSKEAAAYQGRPNGQEACLGCEHLRLPFRPKGDRAWHSDAIGWPLACAVVTGPVVAEGWCRWYQKLATRS
jgi:hypothetical protein